MDEAEDPLFLPEASGLAEGLAIKVHFPRGPGEPPGELVLCRVDGRLYALDTLCPHEGGRLAEGPLMDGRTIHCPLHLYRFRPQDGSAVEVDCPPARTYPVREREDGAEVWVRGAPD